MKGVNIVGIELSGTAFNRIVETAINAGHAYGFGYWAELDGVEHDGDLITAITLHEYEEEGNLKKTLRNADLQVGLMFAINAGESLEEDAIDGPWSERILQYAMFGEIKYA